MILKICSARIRVPLCVAHKPDRMLVSDESNVLCTGNCLHRDFLPLLRYLPDGRLFSDDPACVLRRAEFVSVSFRAEFVSVGLLQGRICFCLSPSGPNLSVSFRAEFVFVCLLQGQICLRRSPQSRICLCLLQGRIYLCLSLSGPNLCLSPSGPNLSVSFRAGFVSVSLRAEFVSVCLLRGRSCLCLSPSGPNLSLFSSCYTPSQVLVNVLLRILLALFLGDHVFLLQLFLLHARSKDGLLVVFWRACMCCPQQNRVAVVSWCYSPEKGS